MKACTSKYELEFISGKFFDCDLPESKRYLLKYFKTALQRQFLKYFFVFGESEMFMDHTGFFCTPYHIVRMEDKLKKIEGEYNIALKKMDVMRLGLIKSGKLRFGKDE